MRQAAGNLPPAPEPTPQRNPDPGLPPAGPAEAIPDTTKDCLAQAFSLQVSDVAPVPVRLYLGAPDDPLTTGPLLAAAAGVAGVAILCTALLSHRVLRPIGRLTAAAQRLGQGDLGGRVPVEGNDELAELGRSFNQMADSLQRGEERQRRLVADVAHELRSPLANLRGYLEALKDGVITPDPELFAYLHEEAVLQQRIVDDLQELALAEAGTLAYHRVQVDLAELLETCRTAHLALAESAGITLRVVAERVLVYADPDRLRQVVGNLITNALHATAAGGNVTLHAARSRSHRGAGTGGRRRVRDRAGRFAARLRPVLAGGLGPRTWHRRQRSRSRHHQADRHRPRRHHQRRERGGRRYDLQYRPAGPGQRVRDSAGRPPDRTPG